MQPKKKYQVFVSSTYEDLKPERNEVMSALLKADCIPSGMELFPAADEDQWALIKRVIRESDYYILIIAGRYGQTINGVSYTQMEYQYAVDRGKKILAFLYSKPEELQYKFCESDPEKNKKLNKFRELARTRPCNFWANKDELAAKVLHAIQEVKKNSKKPGWVHFTPTNINKIRSSVNRQLTKRNEKLKYDNVQMKDHVETLELQLAELNSGISCQVPKSRAVLREMFEKTDQEFKNKISRTGKILRFQKRIDYSSEQLFTSLVKIGIPPDPAMKFILEVIPFLEEIIKSGDQRMISTSDVRIAFLDTIQGYRHSEEAALWCAAYIRRYGSPGTTFIQVLDNEEAQDLNYRYIKDTLIPHVLHRVLGLQSGSSATRLFPEIFSNNGVGEMSRQIMQEINGLNLYTIRYRTLIRLVEDIILEPPHPWFVQEATKARVCKYNTKLAKEHIKRAESPLADSNQAIKVHAYRGFFSHVSAAILAKYGAFLGVGERYGLSELIRIIHIRQNHPALWESCQIQNLQDDLARSGNDIDELKDSLRRVRSQLLKAEQANSEDKYIDAVASLSNSAIFLRSVCSSIAGW